MIDKTLIAVDHTYQRDRVRWEKVARYHAEWSWEACGTLTVFQREDGSYQCGDGQYRLLAAKCRSDIKKMPCMVFRSVSVAHEAGSFRRTNTQRSNPNARMLFKAALVEGDPDAVSIHAMTSADGYLVREGGSDANYVGFPALLLDEQRRDADRLRRAWAVSVAMHRLDAGRQMQSRVFMALCDLDRLLTVQVGENLKMPKNWDTLTQNSHTVTLGWINTQCAQAHKTGRTQGLAALVNRLNATQRRRNRNRLNADALPHHEQVAGAQRKQSDPDHA